MKKIAAFLLAVILVVSMAPTAFANTTTLTTTVPGATYTLDIPAEQNIPFGTAEISIGNVTVTESSGFAEGKDLQVTVSYDAFKCANTTTEIPYTLNLYAELFDGTYEGTQSVPSGNAIIFKGLSTGKVNQFVKIKTSYKNDSLADVDELRLIVNSTDWGKALAGDYISTITFTAEVIQGIAD